MEPTEQQMAGLALQFLAKAQLSGAEVQQFVHVNNWLQQKMTQASAPVQDTIQRVNESLMNEDAD